MQLRLRLLAGDLGISTLLSTVVSVFLFGFEPNLNFVMGAAVVVFSTFMCESASPFLFTYSPAHCSHLLIVPSIESTAFDPPDAVVSAQHV